MSTTSDPLVHDCYARMSTDGRCGICGRALIPVVTDPLNPLPEPAPRAEPRAEAPTTTTCGHGWHWGAQCDEPAKPEAGPMRDTESPSGVQALGSSRLVTSQPLEDAPAPAAPTPEAKERLRMALADAWWAGRRSVSSVPPESATGPDVQRACRAYLDFMLCAPSLRAAAEGAPAPAAPELTREHPYVVSAMEDAFFAGVTRARDPRPIHLNFAAWKRGKK